MTNGGFIPAEDSVKELFVRSVDAVAAYLKAEAGVYRARLVAGALKSRTALVCLIAAAAIVQAAVTAMLVACVAALSASMHPVVAGLVVLVATLIVAYGLVKFAIAKLSRIGSDDKAGDTHA